MKRVLITGAGGFLGSHLVQESPLHFDIFDALGQRVQHGLVSVEAGTAQIPLGGNSQLLQGSYWLSVEGMLVFFHFVKI